MVKISIDTYNKMHFLRQPFESNDETLNRVLSEFPEMEKKCRMLENILVEKKHA
jgi:hypothetical protein